MTLMTRLWCAAIATLALLALAVPAHAWTKAQLDAAYKAQEPPAHVAVVGNPKSHLFFWPGCPNYRRLQHPVKFRDAAAAEGAGYHPARNCNWHRRYH